MTPGRPVSASLLPMGRKRRIALSYYWAILFEGLMLASIGPTLDALSDQTGSSIEEIAILFTASGLGFIAGSLLAGRLYGRLPGNRVLATALFGMAAFTVLVPLVGGLGGLVAVFAAIGMSIGLIDVGGNTLVVWLFRRDVPPYMNALHLAFGVGAFMCPLIVDRLAVATGDAATSFWLFGAAMVPVALWLTRLPDPEGPGDAARDAGGISIVRRHAVFLGLMGVLYFLHVGAELAFGGWIFSYARALEIGGDTTSRILNSVFWGGLVVGRLVAIPLSLRLTPRAMLYVDLVGASAALAMIVLLPDWPPALWVGTAAFGASIASMFATGLNYAGERIPITSQVTAIFVVGAGVGSMTLPWLVGQLFEPRGPGSMLSVVGGAVVAGLALFTWIHARAGPTLPAPAGPGRAGS